MRFAVVQFGGSNCDRDAYHVLADVCGVDTDRVWYKNGSAENITGVLSEGGNVLAMMPHPERASESVLCSEDGVKIFNSMIAHIEEHGHQRHTQ
ncbi:hypothetical protein HL657_04675 [Methanoculleus sp. YWC-01]|uniref:Phosphoribosylformylglycinamidine synthase I n=1 Tax=Methanoculleus nereidis TaxID=2735141 RepID=A0ABU3Z0X6_9EURY|nr:phosphoribosylformylglycinamidine synthase subunit PurQ [Methanoculleus sp. YWC-01]MDV4342472.1 hypothetical protein [Methanoculleus sp. YWC-01]